MQRMNLYVVFVAGLMSLNVAQAGSAPNDLQVVVGSGPFAGTYSAPPTEVICLHSRKQQVYSVAWKSFTPTTGRRLAEAAIEVSRPDDPGAKVGNIRVSFGDPDHNPVVYEIARQSLTMVRKDKTADISLDGKTKSGIRLQVTAICREVEEL